MDGKKTNLTPELKEIYDRVMNTTGAAVLPAKPSASSPNTPPATPQPTAPNPLTPEPAPPPSPLENGLPTPQASPSTMPSIDTVPGAPQPTTPTPAEQALTSTPARPLSEGNTFAFNGKAQQPAPAPTGTAPKKKAKISLPILIVLGVAFLAVWGVFWAIIFGFIQR